MLFRPCIHGVIGLLSLTLFNGAWMLIESVINLFSIATWSSGSSNEYAKFRGSCWKSVTQFSITRDFSLHINLYLGLYFSFLMLKIMYGVLWSLISSVFKTSWCITLSALVLITWSIKVFDFLVGLVMCWRKEKECRMYLYRRCDSLLPFKRSMFKSPSKIIKSFHILQTSLRICSKPN